MRHHGRGKRKGPGVKPCNIGSSEAHNRRTAEYITNIRKEKFYIRTDIMAGNEAWVSPDFGEATLTDRYNQIAAMVKEKTGRAMQTKDRERVNSACSKSACVQAIRWSFSCTACFKLWFAAESRRSSACTA